MVILVFAVIISDLDIINGNKNNLRTIEAQIV